MESPHETRPRSPGWWVVAALAFCLVATLNAGGYRFGVADQAFYLPAIQRHLVPESFPRDRLIIDDQDRLNVFTGVVASAVRVSRIPVTVWFAATYLASMALLFGAAVSLARWMGLSAWAVAAAAAALTLKHRIGLTAANSFEGYGHPRVLAFAVGLWAVLQVVRGRTWWAAALVGAAFVIHPTTALWFGVWVGIAALVADRARRPWFAGAGAAAVAVAVWAIARGPLSAQTVVMDPDWLGVLAGKDYLFPTEWRATAWAMVAAYVLAVGGTFFWRRSRRATSVHEPAMVAGLAGLLAVFAATLPATAAHVAIAVQFQVSRVLWMFDVVGTVYAVWLLADGGRALAAGTRSSRRARSVAACLIVAALARGGYVKWIEHPERPLVRLDLPDNHWQQALDWLARTPVDTLVIANPGHAWRYGTSVRVGAARDVLLEEVKDTAMSMYSRRVAMHVRERIQAVGDFSTLTDSGALALADRYGASYLVDDRSRALPVAYRNERFTIYRLHPD